MEKKKEYIVVNKGVPTISQVINDCAEEFCFPTYKGESLSSILKKLCNHIKAKKLTCIEAGDNIVITGSGDCDTDPYVINADISHTHGIANSLGAVQFTFGVGDNIRFEGTGGTTISYDAFAKKIIINSSSGPGGGPESDPIALASPISVNAGSAISIVGAASQDLGDAPSWTISHADTSSVANQTFTGAQVPNAVTFDTFGHVLSVTKRNLTLSDLGYVAPTESDPIALAKTITINVGIGLIKTGTSTQALAVNPTYTLDHANTSSYAGLNTSGAQVIDILTVDTWGHVTNITTRNLTLGDLGYVAPDDIHNQRAAPQTPGGFWIDGIGEAATFIADTDDAFQYKPSSTYGWELTQRDALKASNLPVLSFRPTTANTAMAVDIMPNGSPSDFGGNGVAWLDVCDTDIKTGNAAVAAARVGITPTVVQIGSMAFNGAAIKPLHLMLGTNPKIQLLTDSTGTINVNTKRLVQSQNVSSDYVGYSLLNTNDVSANADSILFVGANIAAAKFGFLRWSNAATTPNFYRNPNQFEVVANTGATNGLVLGAVAPNIPIKFVTGSSGNTEVARMIGQSTGFGITVPTAILHVKGGTATANTASIKIDVGTLLTTPEDGALEYGSSDIWFTIGSTRYPLIESYRNMIVSAAFTGTTTKTLTLTQLDGGTITASFTDLTSSGGTGLADAYVSITDGTNSASAVGGDTIKFRSANSLLAVLVGDDDVTHGDNVLLTVSAQNIRALLSAGTGISYDNTTGIIINTDLGSSQNIFKNIAVATQSTIVADNNDDTLTIVAGTGIGLTTNATTDTLTITNSAPDQTVVLTEGGAIDITGAYPNFTIAHEDTSSVGDLDTSGAQVIDTLTFDTYGHVTAVTTRDITPGDIGLAYQEIIMIVGDDDAPQDGDTEFDLIDCALDPLTDAHIKVYVERRRYYPVRDYVYNDVTGHITFTQPLEEGQWILIEVDPKAMWTECQVGTTPPSSSLLINDTDSLLINDTDKMLIN